MVERAMLVPDVREEVQARAVEQERGRNRVHGRVAPALRTALSGPARTRGSETEETDLVVEPAFAVEKVKERAVRRPAEEIEVGDLEVAPNYIALSASCAGAVERERQKRTVAAVVLIRVFVGEHEVHRGFVGDKLGMLDDELCFCYQSPGPEHIRRSAAPFVVCQRLGIVSLTSVKVIVQPVEE
jgi:hypothetical protein